MSDTFHPLKSIYKYFYSPEAYRYAFFELKGRGIKYLLFFSIIFTLLASLLSYKSIFYKLNVNIDSLLQYDNIIDDNYSLNENLNIYLNFIADLPRLQIVNNSFESDPKEYKLNFPLKNKSLYFNSLKTSGEIAQSDAYLIFAKDAIMLNEPNNLSILTLDQLIENLHSQNKFNVTSINYILDIISKLPEIEIVEGQLSSSINDVLIKDLYGKNKIFVNTDSTYFNLENNELDLIILKNGFYLKRSSLSDFLLKSEKNAQELVEENYHFVKLEDINKDKIQTLIGNIKRLTSYSGKIMFVIGFAYIVVLYFSKSILICFIATYFCKFMLQKSTPIKVKINDLQRLLSFAFFPILIFEIILTYAITSNNLVKLIVLSLIYGYYIYFALKSVFYLDQNSKNQT